MGRLSTLGDRYMRVKQTWRQVPRMPAGTPVKAKEEDFLLETMVLALLLVVTGHSF